MTPAPPPTDTPVDDEALAGRLRDLALVDLEALIAGGSPVLIAVYGDDVADALRETRTRLVALRAAAGGPDPLSLIDLPPRQRASDTAHAGIERMKAKLLSQAEAARAIARLAELAAALAPKLFEADRRR
jgi:hypothetical protein